jgi:hypothetical protein
MDMNRTLTEAQEYFDRAYTQRITLKYRNGIDRQRDKAEDDIRVLRQRIHRKLFGRKEWNLLWMPCVETKTKNGNYARLHFHLYIGDAPSGSRKINENLGELIRNEWEQMKYSTKSNNPKVRSKIEIIDRPKSIGYGTKTFGDERYIKKQKYLHNKRKEMKWKCWASNTRKNKTAEVRDIEKALEKWRYKNMFECVSNTFHIKSFTATPSQETIWQKCINLTSYQVKNPTYKLYKKT